jgi:CHAT domain-containing protein
MLARLPGTKREAVRSAAAWRRDPSPSFLSGLRLSRSSLRQALDRIPGVLHIAAHIVEHPSSQGQVMIGLGLQDTGTPDFLTPAEIATWNHSTPLVTLSGCGSGRGKAFPGLGLFGLTRAWLLSGAQAVVASYWPVADDDGQLVTAMYGHLAAGDSDASPASVAEALRQAQLGALRSGGTRAHPAHWSAFFVMGRE